MAHVHTDAEKRAAYINFETAANTPKSGKKGVARKKALKRFNNGILAQKRQLGDAILAIEDAKQVIDERRRAVTSWNNGTKTASPTVNPGQLDALQALLQAYVTLVRNFEQLQALQVRYVEGNAAKGHAGRLRTDAANVRDRLGNTIKATDGQASRPGTPRTAGELPERPPSGKPTGAGWVGSWLLGAGSYGDVWLFAKQDPRGNIAKRVAVKDSFYRSEDVVVAWRSRWFWSRDRNEKLVPAEVKTLYDLQGRRGSQYIIQILGWRMSIERKMHRIYTEYYPGGNLMAVHEPSYGPYPGERDYIPEPFIWYCAEALATAGLTMFYGDTAPNPVSEWIPIIHRDWKTANIFLGDPQQLPYGAYPTPKVGDFGFATYNRRDGDHTAANEGPMGTRCFQAPEACIRGMAPFTSTTDVWSVGACLASLMRKTSGLRSSEHDEIEYNRTQFEPDMSTGPAGTYYSKELRDLVNGCMRYQPDDRPSFQQLLKSIQAERKSGRANDEGLWSEPADSTSWSHNNRLKWGTSAQMVYMRLGQPLTSEVDDFQREVVQRNRWVKDLPSPPRQTQYQDDDDEEIGGTPGADMDARSDDEPDA